MLVRELIVMPTVYFQIISAENLGVRGQASQRRCRAMHGISFEFPGSSYPIVALDSSLNQLISQGAYGSAEFSVEMRRPL